MKTECDHVVGVEWGYEESSFTGSLLQKRHMDILKKRKPEENSSGEPNYTSFDFCPECGAKLTTKETK